VTIAHIYIPHGISPFAARDHLRERDAIRLKGNAPTINLGRERVEVLEGSFAKAHRLLSVSDNWTKLGRIAASPTHGAARFNTALNQYAYEVLFSRQRTMLACEVDDEGRYIAASLKDFADSGHRSVTVTGLVHCGPSTKVRAFIHLADDSARGSAGRYVSTSTDEKIAVHHECIPSRYPIDGAPAPSGRMGLRS
jgi:hypothetical protein